MDAGTKGGAAVSTEDDFAAFRRVAGEELDKLREENADLHDTLDAVIAADERAVDLWRAAHHGNELVIPDRAKLVGWLLEQNAALRADKERLDWMASADYWADIAVYRTPQALRAAIDAARKEAQP